MPTTAPDLRSLAVAGKGTTFSIQTSAGASLGNVTTSGTGVTGTGFTAGTSWDGLGIVINGVQYTIASVTSTTALVLTESAGTQTAVPATGPVAYTPVAEIKTLDNSGSKNDSEDVTNFDSAGRFKEYIVTLADAGDFSIAGNYIAGDVGQAAFKAAFNAGTILSFKIVLPLQAAQTVQGEIWVFDGFVSELDNNVSYDKALTFTSKVKVTGPIAVTPGS